MAQPKNRRLVTEAALGLLMDSPVETAAELPAANAGNRGVIRFVTAENEPYYSNGTAWSSVSQGAQGKEGPPGEGVPAGGAPLQVVRKNLAGTTTEWATLTRSSVGLDQVNNTADADKPVSLAMQQELEAKVSVTALEVGLGGKVDKGEIVVNVKDFGAKGDGRMYSGSTVPSGSATVTAPSGVFVAGDVGKFVSVSDDATGYLITGNVTAVTSATILTMSATTTQAITGGVVTVGTDDTAAILAAHAATVYPVRALYFPTGQYIYTQPLTTKVLRGENRQATRLIYRGAGSAIAAGTGIMYHRILSDMTLNGPGQKSDTIALNLDTSPAGMYDRLLVEYFGKGIYLDGTGAADALYNVFDDITVSRAEVGVEFHGLSHENRFHNFRINYAATGVDFHSGGRNVFESCAIEEAGLGVRIRDINPGGNETRANVFAFTRFENNTTNWQIDAGVQYTSLIGVRSIGGANVDNGTGTIKILADGSALTMDKGAFKTSLDAGTGTFTGNITAQQATLNQPTAGASTTVLKVNNSGTGHTIDAPGFRVYSSGSVYAPIVHNPASSSNARLWLSDTGASIDRNVADANPTLLVKQNNAASTGDTLRVADTVGTRARVTASGHLAIRTTTAPTDATLVAGELAFWFDSTNGASKLMVKAKQADGTVRTGSIPLT